MTLFVTAEMYTCSYHADAYHYDKGLWTKQKQKKTNFLFIWLRILTPSEQQHFLCTCPINARKPWIKEQLSEKTGFCLVRSRLYYLLIALVCIGWKSIDQRQTEWKLIEQETAGRFKSRQLRKEMQQRLLNTSLHAGPYILPYSGIRLLVLFVYPTLPIDLQGCWRFFDVTVSVGDGKKEKKRKRQFSDDLYVCSGV